MVAAVIVAFIAAELGFLFAIQSPFDNVEWNDGRAYCTCGISSVAIAAAMFVMTCLYLCFTPLIIGAIITTIGYVSIPVRSLLIRRQDRKKRQSQQEEDEITIRGGPLLHRALYMPISECPGVISIDDEEDEKYDSVF